MRKSVVLLAAFAATATAFAPAGYVGLSRSADTGVTSLSMSAGTGKIRVVSAARAGVPRATLSEAEKRALANYDAAAALGVKSQTISYAKPPSSIGAGTAKSPTPVKKAPAKVGMGTQPVSKPKPIAKPMSTQRISVPAAKPVARPAPKPVARAPAPAPKPAPKPVVKAAPKPVARAAPAPRPVVKPVPRAAPAPRSVVRAAPKAPAFTAPAFKAPAFTVPAFKAPAFKAPSMPSFSSPQRVAPPARSSGGIDLLERVETLRVLTALYNAGALQKVERAGLLSTLEKAGALSQIEKLLPLIEQYKPISLAKSVLSIPAGTFYAGAAAVSAGELGALVALPNDTPFLVLKGISALAAIPLAVGLAIGGQVNGVVQGTSPVNLQSFLGPRLRD